jgi:FRG domain
MARQPTIVENWSEVQAFVDKLYRRRFPIIPNALPWMLYRGQAKKSWDNLKPSLLRLLPALPQSPPEGTPADVRYAMQMVRMLHTEFRTHVQRHMPSYLLPGLEQIEGSWALMQHYRAPTRLLDWTGSPFTSRSTSPLRILGMRMVWSGISNQHRFRSTSNTFMERQPPVKCPAQFHHSWTTIKMIAA